MHDAATAEKEVRDRLLELGDKLRDISTKPADEREKYAEEVRAAQAEIGVLDSRHVALSAARNLERPAGNGPTAATMRGGAPQVRTFGERLIGTEAGSDDYRDWITSGRKGGAFVVEQRGNLGDTRAVRDAAIREVRALFDEADTGSTSAFQFLPLGTPYLDPAGVDRIRLFVQDIIGAGQTTLSSVPYIRELNPRTTEAGVTSVAEGTAKPELTSTFQRDDAPVRKVAGYFPVTEEILADAPTVRSYLDDRLRYMVALAEERQILNGNGTAPDLKGILTFSQVQAQSFSNSVIESVAQGVAKIELVDGEPDAVVANPTDFWSMMTHRASSSGVMDALGGWLGDPGQQNPLGLKWIRTRNQASGHMTVGAWRLGAQLLRREDYTVRIGDQHADYFIKNLLVILGESRLALAVHRPDFFVKVALS